MKAVSVSAVEADLPADRVVQLGGVQAEVRVRDAQAVGRERAADRAEARGTVVVLGGGDGTVEQFRQARTVGQRLLAPLDETARERRRMPRLRTLIGSVRSGRYGSVDLVLDLVCGQGEQ